MVPRRDWTRQSEALRGEAPRQDTTLSQRKAYETVLPIWGLSSEECCKCLPWSAGGRITQLNLALDPPCLYQAYKIMEMCNAGNREASSGLFPVGTLGKVSAVKSAGSRIMSSRRQGSGMSFGWVN